MGWDLMVYIGPGPEPARPGPARFAWFRPGKARAHGRPGKARAPTARTTPPQHAQDSQAQYGSTSGCSRRIHSALHSGPQIAPARHGPAPLTRITHGPNWGNPFVTHFIDHESWGQGVLLQMGGPPNTFTGATQPIPVRGDGSAQAGLPDANTGRDTRGVVNKHIQLCAVSLLTLCAYELDRVAGYRRWILNC